ncbi:MAG: hypothetical protein BWX99_02816 [Deltaproteobacteria bacterium ADurb.Bin151]|nr:MAG: hypothetical protein BWX99_02816 [Deltaproteobacteria bacterium ADurb.Bin151]
MGRQTIHFHLDLQVTDQGYQVRIPATLAIAVDRSLHHPDPFTYSGDGIGDGKAAVVMNMNPRLLNWNRFGNLFDDFSNFIRHGSAVRVAVYDPVHARLQSGLDDPQGVAGIMLVPVKKMLRVKQHFLACGF